MAGMIVFSMLLTLLFGGGMLALVLGFLETEKSRARELAAATAGDSAPAPEAVREHSFFANLEEGSPAAQPDQPDDEMVDELESFLKEEQVFAARFVNEPSIDNLYRHATLSPAIN